MTPRWSKIGTHALGGLLGGLAGGGFVVLLTVALKTLMDYVAAQSAWVIIVVPLVGLALSVLVLYRVGRKQGVYCHFAPWRTFPPDAVRADISGDVVENAGVEEHFPWRLAPIRAVAIFATVGLGGAMGTESPAAYLGTAGGACLTDRGGRWWRNLLRPAALGGGAAGVAALMGFPLIGSAYILELGRRNRAPLSVERLVAGLIGGLVGWGIDVVFRINLIRLIVPQVAPESFGQAAITALFIGATAGVITGAAGWAISRAKKWKAAPATRLFIGGLAMALTAITLVLIAEPMAAVGPGGGAILWAENSNALPWTLLGVAILRGIATTAATAAGGCGGIFIPFIAVGDLAGRVFAPGFGVSNDLAGAAGAAGGIAGGYRLPFTAVAMVVSVGGPHLATLTCLGTVLVAWVAGLVTRSTLDKFKAKSPAEASPPVPSPV